VKRVLRWLGIVVVVIVALIGGGWFYAFGSNSPIVGGQELAPGVETVKDGFVSAFLVDVGDKKVALVDAGNDKAAKEILAALAKRSLTADAVVAILLTHGHGDHTAGCRVFPHAEVYAMESEIPVIGDAAKVTHPLKDGERFDIGDQHVEAFATPGHTPGSAVFLARGVLFFGDSAGASTHGEVMRAVRLFSKDSNQNVASLKALDARLEPRASEIKKLAFAHTGPLDGLGPLDVFAKRN
jgi:hydroxyacylglutathione hydrolase